MNNIKVSLNELISLASYSIEQSTVPNWDTIVNNFSPIWEDIYLDEELKEQEGKNCFIIYDDCNCGYIRYIAVAEDLDSRTKAMLLYVMDNIIYDLLYSDIVEQIESDSMSESLEDLLEYVRDNNITISDYEYSWLIIMAENRLDLLEL